MSNFRTASLKIDDLDGATLRVGFWLNAIPTSKKPFFVEISAQNFEAVASIAADDLREIRDWINTALASVEPHTEGVGA